MLFAFKPAEDREVSISYFLKLKPGASSFYENFALRLEVVKVSTRGAVLFEVSDGCYEAYYNHCDAYPTWLGVRLAEMLKQGLTENLL